MMDKPIPVKEALEKLKEMGFDDKTLVFFNEGTNVITVKFIRIGSSYSCIAPCGHYSHSECIHHWDEHEECRSCTFYRRYGGLYKTIDGVRYKYCKHCGQFLPEKENFYMKPNGIGSRGWCKECQRSYSRARNRNINQKSKSHEKESLQDEMCL